MQSNYFPLAIKFFDINIKINIDVRRPLKEKSLFRIKVYLYIATKKHVIDRFYSHCTVRIKILVTQVNTISRDDPAETFLVAFSARQDKRDQRKTQTNIQESAMRMK